PGSLNSSASSIRKSYFTDICANSSNRLKRKVQMSNRFRASAVALTVVVAVALLIPVGASAQAQPAAKAPVNPAAKKTPDGQPDIQGFWSSQTNTPLERDPNCGTKEFWTDEEIAKGVRTCGAAAAGRGQRGAGPGGAAGQRGRGQRSNGEVDPHYDTAQ